MQLYQSISVLACLLTGEGERGGVEGGSGLVQAAVAGGSRRDEEEEREQTRRGETDRDGSHHREQKKGRSVRYFRLREAHREAASRTMILVPDEY